MLHPSAIAAVCDTATTARLFGVTARAIRRLLKEGRLPLTPIRIGTRPKFRGFEIEAIANDRGPLSLEAFRELCGVRVSASLSVTTCHGRPNDGIVARPARQTCRNWSLR